MSVPNILMTYKYSVTAQRHSKMTHNKPIEANR